MREGRIETNQEAEAFIGLVIDRSYIATELRSGLSDHG
jgi:hypothetical protein